MKELAILGTGCAKCTKLAANVREAVSDLGVEAEIRKVTDIQEIMKYGVMMTPTLVVDGEVKAVGKVLSVDDIKGMLI